MVGDQAGAGELPVSFPPQEGCLMTLEDTERSSSVASGRHNNMQGLQDSGWAVCMIQSQYCHEWHSQQFHGWVLNSVFFVFVFVFVFVEM